MPPFTASYTLRNSRKWIYSYRCNVHSSTQPLVFGGTYKVHEAGCLRHYIKKWEKLRMNKLTASTFSSAIGFWPRRRVQLWLEKIGAIEPFYGNIATFYSNINEEKALERYKLATNRSVVVPAFQIYGENKWKDGWLGASPDGVIEENVYGLPSRGVLEIKCPLFDGDATKTFPWKRIPLYCMPQAQGLMEILDRDWMDFYVWTPNGSNLFRLYRDTEYWDIIKIALDDFWWNHVLPAKELYKKSVITNPLTQLRSLKPDPEHEYCRYIVCESKRLVDKKSELLFREINGILID